MKIIIGSKNPTKIQAVEDVFSGSKVISMDVPSKVNAQPFSDEETREGAVNRATSCVNEDPAAIGIGLEGGVMEIGDHLYLCNWGALVTGNGQVYTASGARIPLPKEIQQELQRGFELGDVMDTYAKKTGVRKKEGAIGIFTNEVVSRKEMFTHVVKLLRGQLDYWN